jgi:hypothetical protein
MSRAVYSVLLVCFGVAISFIGLLVIGGYNSQGKAAIGAGVLWGYSIPAYILLGLVLVQFSYGCFSSRVTLGSQVSSLAVVAGAIAILGPAVTLFTFWFRNLVW